MSHNTFRILVGLFIIAHGLMTMSLATVPPPAAGALRTPFFPSWWRASVDPLWPIIKLGLPEPLVRTFGWLLWMSILMLFTLAGAGLLGFPGLTTIWQSLAAVAAGLSLVLLVLFWHPGLCWVSSSTCLSFSACPWDGLRVGLLIRKWKC
jgi:hypothetical protein